MPHKGGIVSIRAMNKTPNATKGDAAPVTHPKSAEVFRHNRRFIPGGVASVNRAVQPEIVFTKGKGAYIWDLEGNRYIDYHAAFAPHFLGHNDPYVTEAIISVLREDASLYGSGTTELEGRLAELICRTVPAAESVELLNTGSEATCQAIRLARAVTHRDHIIVHICAPKNCVMKLDAATVDVPLDCAFTKHS